MKSHLCLSLICVSVLLPSTALAGKGGSSDRPEWGGLGYMTQGWAIGDIGGTGESLAAAPNMGLLLGGGGMALLGGRVVVGGQGYALHGLGGGDDALDVQVSGGGGGFHLGFAAINDHNDLIYPYVGAAFHGHDVLLANGHLPTSIAGVELEPGQRDALTGGGGSLDLGVTMFRLFWGDESGGMALGASLGGWIPLTSETWSAESGAATTVDSTLGGLYLRVNVGGGGAFRG